MVACMCWLDYLTKYVIFCPTWEMTLDDPEESRVRSCPVFSGPVAVDGTTCGRAREFTILSVGHERRCSDARRWQCGRDCKQSRWPLSECTPSGSPLQEAQQGVTHWDLLSFNHHCDVASLSSSALVSGCGGGCRSAVSAHISRTRRRTVPCGPPQIKWMLSDLSTFLECPHASVRLR